MADGPADPCAAEFEKAARLAARALDRARQHRCPPRPHAYEIWYTYVSGEDAALKARVDSELLKRDVVDPEVIEQIYEEHFLQKRLSRGITRIGNELDAGLRDALATIREGAESSHRFAERLRAARERIPGAGGRADVRRLANELLELGEMQAQQSETIHSELTRVQAQVVELQRELERLRDRAYLDHLTQIANRRHLDEVLEREIATAQRTGEPLSFALFDLDHFKQLNDAYGHAIGDAVLKHFAALLKENVKGQDTPARFGGEEFALVLPRTSVFNAHRVVDAIRRIMAETDFILSRDCSSIGRVTVSVGVTQLLASDTAATLVERADALLYRAKRGGRNRVESDL